jgi:hypothetical protein
LIGFAITSSFFTHQLQNSLCIYDADVLEKLCQQHIIGLYPGQPAFIQKALTAPFNPPLLRGD